MTRSSESKPWIRLGILIAIFLVLSSWTYKSYDNIFSSNYGGATDNSNLVLNTTGIPTRLKIPSIQIDAQIERVGLTPNGAMDVPKKKEDTGWLETGPLLGEIGTSVIAGHRGWKVGRAVFDDLHQIKIGDEVYVEDETGKEYVYKVREMHTYDATENIPEVWGGGDYSHLNLITCSGEWNTLTQTSDKRLVVFTDLVK